MKTIEELYNNAKLNYLETDENGGLFENTVKKLMLEYGKQVLQLASEKADFIRLPSISDEDDETIVYDYEIDKNSILNLINELK